MQKYPSLYGGFGFGQLHDLAVGRIAQVIGLLYGLVAAPGFWLAAGIVVVLIMVVLYVYGRLSDGG